MARYEITALQYLRGMAAISVTIDHTNAIMSFPKYFGRNNGSYLNSGSLGVNLFFIISGFIITLVSLEINQGHFSPRISISEYALKRFARIFPIMWIAIATYFLGRALGRDANFSYSYIRAFFLVPFGTVEPNNIWTLRHETLFYLIFGLSLLVRRPRPWILALWFLSPFIYAAATLPTDPMTPGMQFIRIVTHPCNLEFACGMAIGLAWHRWTRNYEITTPIPSGLLVAMLYGGFWLVCATLNVGLDTVYSCAVSSLIGGAVIFIAVHLRCNNGPFERLLAYLGDASFSIYLFHLHFASASLGIWSKHFKSTPTSIVLAGTTLFAVAGAILVYELVEKPVHRLSYKLLARKLA